MLIVCNHNDFAPHCTVELVHTPCICVLLHSPLPGMCDDDCCVHLSSNNLPNVSLSPPQALALA